jgi:hypothetical protein
MKRLNPLLDRIESHQALESHSITAVQWCHISSFLDTQHNSMILEFLNFSWKVQGSSYFKHGKYKDRCGVCKSMYRLK